jgi:hypothetical protein
LTLVVAGLVPAIHVFGLRRSKTWMPGTRPGMTDSVSPRLRRRVEGAVADFKFVMFAAMRAANMEGNEAQFASIRLICFSALDSRVDLLAGDWTRERQSTHATTSRNRLMTKRNFHQTIIIW